MDLSRLRPNGSKVNNAAKTSTGLVSFAEQYSDSTGRCAQDGRRGALMLSVSDTHDEVIDFINAKRDLEKINNANISVMVSDDTMWIEKQRRGIKTKKVGGDTDVNEPDGADLHWGVPSVKGSGKKKVNPSLIQSIAESMHQSAEPGLLWIDRIRLESPADKYEGFETVSTNPCGEVPLARYDSCRLLHVNLLSCVSQPFTKDAEFDFELFAKNVRYGQRFLDDIIDLEEEKVRLILAKLEKDPESPEEKAVEFNLWKKVLEKLVQGRRTGLGFTGLADVFAMMGMRYGSDKSIRLAEEIAKERAISSYKESILLAKERGAFPIFSHSKEHNQVFIERVMSLIDDEKEYADMYARYGRRNIANMTIAPTGTISLLTRTTSGIEPCFDIVHYRTIKNFKGKKEETTQVLVVHEPFKMWYDINILPKTNVPFEELTMDQIQGLIPDSPYAKSIAHEVDPYAKIEIQGKLQRWTDHSISVTMNAKASTTVDEIVNMILTAHEKGCKGFTFYRDGSRSGILSSYKGEVKKSGFSQQDAIHRPEMIDGYVDLVTVAGQKIGIAIGLIDGQPYEVFSFNVDNTMADTIKNDMTDIKIIKVKSKVYSLSWKSKATGEVGTLSGFNKKTTPDAELVCRLISISLRHGVDINFVYEQIHKPNADINNFAKAVSRTFKKFLKDDTLNRKTDVCPHCGAEIRFVEGCATCTSCGMFSKC